MLHNSSSKEGQVLIWAILAIVIIAIVLVLGAQFISVSLKGRETSKEKIISPQLAQECLEAVRTIGQSDWHILYDANTSESQLNYYHPTTTPDNKWTLTQGLEEMSSPFEGYKRGLLFYKVSRDDNGDIQITYDSNKDDPSTRKVIVKVFKNKLGKDVEIVSANYYLTRWQNEIKLETKDTWLGGQYSDIDEVLASSTALMLQTKAYWYDSRWPYRMRITIDYHQVSSTQTNFPVLVST
ncbi:hypothetical protein COX75_02565, partial [bacterium (Candidatus Gribaldobacteria) CG_4_10_14_0_2_um_filter_33_15]